MSEGERRYVPSAADRGPAICEHCGKPGERTGDRINPEGWFWFAAKFDPEGKPKHAADDRLIIHACSIECRDALWSCKPRTFGKAKPSDRLKRCPDCHAGLTPHGEWRRYHAVDFHRITCENAKGGAVYIGGGR